MKLHESIEIIDKIGLTKWISINIDETTRIFVNALAQYHLSDADPLSYRPFTEWDNLYSYFDEHDSVPDWYELLGNDFVENVEQRARDISNYLRDYDPMLSLEEYDEMVVRWAWEWRQNARVGLRQSIGEDLSKERFEG